MLRAAEGTETTHDNIQDCFGLDEGDAGFQLPVFSFVFKSRLYSDFFLIFISTTYIIYLPKFCLLELYFTSLIQIIA